MKPWDPRIITGGRRFRRGTQWDPIPGVGRRGGRPGAGELRLTVLGGVVLGLAVALAWPTANGVMTPPRLATPPAEGRGQAATVRVIDGDTFDYDGMRVRVADIDTPEIDGRCADETQLAARATRRMAALLAAGPFELHRAPDGRDADRYGRKLRIVTRGGRSLGDQLVGEGLARTWAGQREPWC